MENNNRVSWTAFPLNYVSSRIQARRLPSALREPRVYLARHAPIAALFQFKRFICTLYHPRLASRKIERLNSYTRRAYHVAVESIYLLERCATVGTQRAARQYFPVIVVGERVYVSSCTTREITLTVSLLKSKRERERENFEGSLRLTEIGDHRWDRKRDTLNVEIFRK